MHSINNPGSGRCQAVLLYLDVHADLPVSCSSFQPEMSSVPSRTQAYPKLGAHLDI